MVELEQAPSKDKAKKVDSILTYVAQLIVAAIVGAVLAYRKQIAAANGIGGYAGTYTQNVTMLTLLKNGRLIAA